MDRLVELRRAVDTVILGVADPVDRRCAYVHLYGVSQAASALALKRGLDPGIAAASGLLHDLYAYRTGITAFHDQNSAEEARPLVRDAGCFTPGEQFSIVSAIFHHSDKESAHGPYEELLKDADVLQHYLYDTSVPIAAGRAERLTGVLREWGLPCDFHTSPRAHPMGTGMNLGDRRTALADTAEGLAAMSIEGVPDDPHFTLICRYWPGDDVFAEFRYAWCAAFVYHCCHEVGLALPIRHPLVSCRFGAVKGWLQWACLQETAFFHPVDDPQFVPGRGDVVIYDRLVSDEPHDHIGVVLASDGGEIAVAEGNGEANRSVILTRSRTRNVLGFVRIDDRWEYQDRGRRYDPLVVASSSS